MRYYYRKQFDAEFSVMFAAWMKSKMGLYSLSTTKGQCKLRNMAFYSSIR